MRDGQTVADGAGRGEAPVVVRARSQWPWAIATVAIVLMLLIGLPTIYVIYKLVNAPADAVGAAGRMVADAARPKIDIHSLALVTVEDVQRQSKLVVLQTTVTASIERAESAQSWGVYWGTNTARVVAREVKVQYAIDLRQFGESDLEYSASRRVVMVRVPRPVLDEEMVAIDPAKIETLSVQGGWARFDKQETRERAVQELKPRAVLAAKGMLIKKEAEAAGLEAMGNVLKPLAGRLGAQGVRVAVGYR